MEELPRNEIARAGNSDPREGGHDTLARRNAAFRGKGTPQRKTLLFQVDWVHPGAASRRIPNREPDPFLTSRVEGNVELLGPKRHAVFKIDVLVLGLDAIAPHQVCKFERE